jgi:hypothetical protein
MYYCIVCELIVTLICNIIRHQYYDFRLKFNEFESQINWKKFNFLNVIKKKKVFLFIS